jgi:hypothetical protein
MTLDAAALVAGPYPTVSSNNATFAVHGSRARRPPRGQRIVSYRFKPYAAALVMAGILIALAWTGVAEMTHPKKGLHQVRGQSQRRTMCARSQHAAAQWRAAARAAACAAG